MPDVEAQLDQMKYQVTMSMRSGWIAGYHPEKDEMFLYFVDQDDLCWVFTRGGIDSIGFAEFMNFEAAEILGPL